MSARTGGDSSGTVAWSRPGQVIGLLLRGYTVRTAAPVALLVGAVLSAVNQGAVIFSGHASLSTWIRVAVNFVVPFTVASWGYLAAHRIRRPSSAGLAAGTPPPR